MFARIRRLLAPPVFKGDEDTTRMARLLNAVLLSFLGAVFVYGIIAIALPNPQAALPLVGLVIVMNLVAFFLMRRGRVQAASLLFSSAVWLFLTAVAVLFGGVSGPAFFGYIVVVVVAGLLLGGRAALFFAGLSIVTGLGMVWAEGRGIMPPPLGPNLPISIWAALTLYVILTAALLQIATSSLREALGHARVYATELEEQREHLEEAVEERTRDLARRASRQEATAAIARDAASVLDVQALLSRVVTLISEQFGYYHAGIFLLDPSREWAVLQAASSKGGRRMLARGHRLRVGLQGIVGYVTGRNEPHIALDVGEDAVFFDNPDLPDTRSEMALPLRARGEVIGALDVQSITPAAFAEEDVAVLQTLADQVAVAISNARLFQQAQESLEAERRAYGELAGRAWWELLHASPDLGFLSDLQDTVPAGDLWRPEMKTALRTGKITPADGGAATLAIPIQVRGQIIGVVDGRKPEGAGEWTAEEIELLETLTEQLEPALESARLYQDTQRRAARERLIGEVTSRMRETLDMERVLKTAVDEIARALGLAALDLRLGGAPVSEAQSGEAPTNGQIGT
jgi:GAF domain-containing protein